MKNILYAFNISRQSFISLSVTSADGCFTRLRGLLGRRKLKTSEALWVAPSRGIHTFGLFTPIDAVYLDRACRVVHLIENLGPLRMGPIRRSCASVLELPAGSIYNSGTQIGDRLLIQSPAEVDRYLESQHHESPVVNQTTT